MDRRQFLKQNTMGLLGAGLLTSQPAMAQSKKRPNILWIMLDDGRADALGCYNAPWAQTPNLNRLAAEGVRFETAIVQNPVCVPSRRSMKTGFYAHEVGPVAMGRPPETPGAYIDQNKMRAIEEAPNLLDAWTQVGIKPVNIGKVHGYRKSFDQLGDAPTLLNVHGKPTIHFKKMFGEKSALEKTKQVVTDTHKWQIGGVVDVPPEQTERWVLGNMAVDKIEELTQKDEPFFLRVSFHAPHVACYVPPEYYIDPKTIDLPLPTEDELASKPKFEQGPLKTYAGASLSREEIDICRGTYYGMVSLVDVQVGRIIEALKKAGALDNTIIAFTSDQGFQLGEHGLWKKRVFYDANVKVPFFIRYPRALPLGKVIDEPVEMIDFLPTLMELSHLETPQNIRGRSLKPLIDGDVSTWREACFSEIDHSRSMYKELRQGTGRRVMVRTKEWKMIFFMDERVKDKDGALYNLQTDPGETKNVYHDPQYKDVIQYLGTLAREWDRQG
ncbi:sulfatase-like hydrolase/transferase [bacterium]|nr:sulfatase-like hydrolase/transferase [bacterium]